MTGNWSLLPTESGMEKTVDQPGTEAPHCPRCRAALAAGASHSVNLYLCQSCRGVLLRRKSLVRLLTALGRELAGTLDPDRDIEAVPDRGAGLSCPLCRGGMDNFGYMGSKQVILDTCPACDVLWLDPRELGAAALLYARTNLRQQRARDASEARRRELSRNVDAAVLANATSSALLGGFVLGRMSRGLF
jgi:Zn-finger nucleic acid-binding protein